MATNLIRTVPKWMKDASQGLAYWLGYSAERDPTKAPELALGHELARLLGAKAKNLEVHTESYYDRIRRFASADLTKGARADVTLWKNSRPNSFIPTLELKFVIEIKRSTAKASKIKADLRRLAAVAEELPGVRAFLLVVSQNALPPEPFSSSRGLRLKPHAYHIVGTNSEYVVTAVFKAAPAFQHPDKAHYVCIAEVCRQPEFDPFDDDQP